MVVPILWLGINFSSLTTKNKCFGINFIILSLNFIYLLCDKRIENVKFTFKYGIRIGITDISITTVPILWLGINFFSQIN